MAKKYINKLQPEEYYEVMPDGTLIRVVDGKSEVTTTQTEQMLQKSKQFLLQEDSAKSAYMRLQESVCS